MGNFHPALILKINTMKDTKRLDPVFKDVVLKFLFVFNIFESEFFSEPKWDEATSGNKSDYKTVPKRINEIQKFCNKNKYPLDFLEKFQSHFSEVYIENNRWSERFYSLQKSEHNKNGFGEQDMEHLYDFLTSSLISDKYAIKYALLLSYKFRNNLFHGQKDICELKLYKDDFIEITDFLISLMRYLDSINADEF